MGRERVGRFGCYDIIVTSSMVTWYEANNHCTDIGKALLAIGSEEENDAIESHLGQNKGAYFTFVMTRDLPFHWTKY